MRRTHAAQYYGHQPNLYSAGNELEEENEKMTDELKEKINVLKSLSIDIGSEVKIHGQLLQAMDDDFEKTGSFLGNTRNRVLRLAKGAQNYYILYLFLFSIFVFFILYIVLKFR
ncbi:BET1 homolog [Anabrus simplex]|uniref:BET1 homolog n=1 Tax=Anabrus simplex TaxID=316456 RepID=UPI0034DD635A